MTPIFWGMSETDLLSVFLAFILLLPGASLLAGAWAHVRRQLLLKKGSSRIRALEKAWGVRVVPWPKEAIPQVFPDRLGTEACVADVDGRHVGVIFMDAVGLIEDRGTDWVVMGSDGSPRVVAHARSEVEVWREALVRYSGGEASTMLVAPTGFYWPNGRPARGVVGEERLGEALDLARRLTQGLAKAPWPPFPPPQMTPWMWFRMCLVAVGQGIAGGILLVGGLALAVAGGDWALELTRVWG